MANRKKGFWIDQQIMDDKNLDCADRFILSEIYSLCKLKDGCIASDEHFAKIVNLSISNVNKRINRLKVLGYIKTFIHTINKKILGRTITINTIEVLDHNDESSISKTEKLVYQNGELSISNSDEVVFQDYDISISPVNITNTVTNSLIINQEIIQNNGEVMNSFVDMNQFLNNRFEELLVELVDKSSLGEDIFFYTDPVNLEFFRDVVDDNEYNLVYPILANVIEISRKLYG